MGEDTTTVEVKHDTYRALDLRKDVGESFDGAIKRLIGQTGPGVGAVETDDAIETGEIRELDDPPAGATCSYYDMIGGETCGDTATHLQTVTYNDGDGQELYLCSKHAGADE